MSDPHFSQVPQTSPSATGLASNVGGALAYLLGPITGILFLVLEKENRFVRFHAAQSTGFGVLWVVGWVVLTVVSYVVGYVPVFGLIVALGLWLVSIPLALAGLVLWLALMVQAYQGREWQIPLIGPHAMQVADQGRLGS